MELLRPNRGDRILDASAGTGLFAKAILERTQGKVELALIDISAGMLAVAQMRLQKYPQVTILEQDVHKTTFKTGTFSQVVSANSFHYYADANTVLQEFNRVLKKSGVLVITDWSRNTVRFKLFNTFLKIIDPAHGHIYSTLEMTALLQKNGFVVEEHRQFSSGLWSLLSIRARKV